MNCDLLRVTCARFDICVPVEDVRGVIVTRSRRMDLRLPERHVWNVVLLLAGPARQHLGQYPTREAALDLQEQVFRIMGWWPLDLFSERIAVEPL